MVEQMRVLIIEDSAVLRRLVETCFRDFDFEFSAQRIPYSTQRLGGFEETDLVIIGVYQPLTTGIEIIRRLKRRQQPPAVVALTTDTREESISEIAQSGADEVVRMPFRPDDLRTAVKAALNSRLEH
jgi:DNA-binding response OmpR family regulator